MDKIYLSYNEVHRIVDKLSVDIKKANYDPDLIVAIGSGGFIPARIMRNFINKPILAVGIAFYDENDRPTELPRKVQWISEAEDHLEGKKILLVDEIDDTRMTLEFCIRELLLHKPAQIAVAVLHNKTKEKSGTIPSEVTHYFYGASIPDQWIVYPWQSADIDEHEKHVRK